MSAAVALNRGRLHNGWMVRPVDHDHAWATCELVELDGEFIGRGDEPACEVGNVGHWGLAFS
jgi:hypothetical protein